MADINHIISLGIGTPSDIPHFILFGLSINDNVAPLPQSVHVLGVTGQDYEVRGVTGRAARVDDVEGH